MLKNFLPSLSTLPAFPTRMGEWVSVGDYASTLQKFLMNEDEAQEN